MQETSPATGGQQYADDALPIEDLKEAPLPPFEVKDAVVYLRGSRSQSSGSMAFPERDVCLQTGARDMEPFLFGPDATLYSYTTVHVSSARPVPYTLGYVDFPNGVRVLAHVLADPAQPLHCGQSVRLRADGERWFVTPA
ncbi:Predicted nucleic-acid-binding protein containing a Zn-ribbon [Bordetella pertussis]|uniref:ChsH2 C-terminal OB-fold domain-containing protein n=1 Tax=Bordetella pertussis (strain ATCC 9797 / DSM 5571 / CCUG 30873 / LMG 14455 / NCTC 10739 / 18323) TaxID=568706 RepID=A0A0T7CPR7_BORP1|nr:OB-fold domain-containing protein [Bordetella pertussis]AZR85221.1 hypothetical protein BBB37_11310 [Bordetella pertussis]PNO98069.1 hypothetical protein AL465_003585 [Bordetella pertussis 18323]UEB58437.1 OB-fold domain-containing protein [Bordetella pertussis]CCJ63625.1 Conserved hypothetical protein [Bordetella pertussis 18323]CFP47775.1 Predicted nucleic-acid-binding protein containing a Zn-ribbon [Bordetella pertussis]